MSHLSIIFAVWDDNAEAMAFDIGEKGVTVRQWRNRGDIPSRAAQLKIIRAAFEKNGTVLKLEDFLSPEERRTLPIADHGGTDSVAERSASATKALGNIGGSVQAPRPGNISGENICAEADERGEADSHGPFSVSPTTCSTAALPSPVSSTGTAKAA